MGERAERLWTVDEFLAWDDGTQTRYELIDGVITAMTAPANAHGRVVANTLIRLARNVPPNCAPQVEAGIRISDVTWWQADIAITCGPVTPGSEIADPVLIVEVLSPTTPGHDLDRKLGDYKALSSVQEIWLADSERRWVQIWWREAEVWTGRDHVGAGDFTSPFLRAAIGLEDLYRGF